MNKMMGKITSALLIGLLIVAPISLAQSKKEVSLADASKSVRLNTQGKILSAKTTQSNGRKTHKIQVLTPSGRVKTFRVPVNNGNDNRNSSSRNNARLRKPATVNRGHQRANNHRSRTQTSRSAVIKNSENSEKK